jgi:putative tricarboxylic transport membrane protein
MMPRWRDLFLCRWTLLWGSLIGFIVGVLPGVGATASTMLAYGAAKKMSAHPEEFGKGAIEGVAAPEAANNSSSYGNMVTLFTLGIPSSATTAVLMGGLLMVGLQPGPRMFQEHSEFIWTLFGTFYVGNLALVFLTIFLTPLLAAVIFVSRGLLFAIVTGIILYGVYSISYSLEDIWIMLAFGVLGYVMGKLDYPAVPAVLGVVLGPLLELGVRRTLIASQGDFSVFVERPISLILFIIAAAIFIIPVITKYIKPAKGLTMEPPAVR